MDVPSFEFDLLIDKNARKKYSCPMCKEILIFAVKTSCNHRFCKYCITKWMMHFDECPACRQKILSTAPHPRTDKWIQQLFDMATPEFKEDRAMCVNYRKLQQVKLELTRGNEIKQTRHLSKDALLEEFSLGTSLKNAKKSKNAKSSSNLSSKSKDKEAKKSLQPVLSSPKVNTVNTNTDQTINDNNNNSKSSGDIMKHENEPTSNANNAMAMTMPPIAFSGTDSDVGFLGKNLYGLSGNGDLPGNLFGEEDERKYCSDDITALFGIGTINLNDHSTTDYRQLLSSSSPDLIRVRVEDDQDDTDEKESVTSTNRGSQNGESVDVDDIFPPAVNSAHTFSLHYPGIHEGRGGVNSRLFTLAELTCHDELVFVDDNHNLEEAAEWKLVQGTKSFQEMTAKQTFDNIYGTGAGAGDTISDGRLTLQENADTTQMNLVKAENMRARIQHEIALASLPRLSPARHSTHGFCGLSNKYSMATPAAGVTSTTSGAATTTHSSTIGPPGLSSQREKQDLQTCREALLNLRLRLLPPAKRTPTAAVVGGANSSIPGSGSGPLKELNKRTNSDAQFQSHLNSQQGVGEEIVKKNKEIGLEKVSK